ncbi:MAG: hypothetical protein QM640_12310 [Niabella sp.]
MKKRTPAFLFSLSFLLITAVNAQTIENRLSAWKKLNPIEKVYLHTDRDVYYSGQTIWFKGYFLSDYVPSGSSSTLYVELLNSAGTLIVRNVFPAYMGSAPGQIDLPQNLPGGTYQLRAYSPVMLNQPGFVFTKTIQIFGVAVKNKSGNIAPDKTQLAFFPEGGNFITGILNIVAFKATDKNGLPVNVAGSIINDKGETISDFHSMHDGMGSFAIIPLSNTSFYAVIEGSTEKYPLPQSTANGITLSIQSTEKGKQIRILQANDNPDFQPAYLIGQMENEILFKQPLKSSKKEINVLVETTGDYSGIMQLTVFNKDNMPLAERITFIDNKDYVLPATLKLDTLDTGAKMRNHFSIALPDTIIGNFSVSVTDADYDGPENRTQNIFSWFLLSSNIRGYVHNPSYYFASAADSVKKALDLVMMTNGWTRFKWTDVAQNKLPAPLYKDPGYIKLDGTVNIDGTKKPLANRDIIMMMSPTDTTYGKGGVPRFLHTDSLGNFKMDSLIFYDKMKILFSDIRGNKSKYIKVKLDGDSIHRRYNVLPTAIPADDSSTSEDLQNKMKNAYSSYLSAEGKTLETVTVRAREKSVAEKLDEQYASGLFANNINGKTFDLRDETFSGDVFQYLQGRVPGLSVSGTPGNYELSYRGGGFGGSNVSLYLDEMPTDATMIESIPVSQIAMVKLLPNSVAAPGGGTVLAVYMKKGADLSAAIDSPTDIITYNGYTIVKEFYNPDYDKNPQADKPDNRLTLSWNPHIFFAKINPVIPVIFYNNEHTKRFKIVAEGITNDGRMLMLEKIIEPGK